MAFIGAIRARIAPALRNALNSVSNGAGGNWSKASQLVSTRRPMREASVSTTNWLTAPPESLPTSVTSSSPIASRNDSTCLATPRGDWSAPSFSANGCDPSGQSGAYERMPCPASAAAVPLQSVPSVRKPPMNTTGGAVESSGPATR